MNIFPDKKQNKTKQESAGRIPPRCTNVTVCCAAAAGLALERGQLEPGDEMEKFQRRNTCTQTIIGDFCHPKKAHVTSAPRQSSVMLVDSFLTGTLEKQPLGWRYFKKV